MTQVAQSKVFVDGNNVMGSRPDGWWRDRADAARRLVADIIPLATRHGGAWTIVFDGKEPPAMPPSPECLTAIHTGHRRRDGADVVLAVAGMGSGYAQERADVHGVNARAHAEALKLAYFRLEDLITQRSTQAVSWLGNVPPGTVGGVNGGWLAAWTERGVRARYCTDDPAVPGTLLVWLDPARLMGLGGDHRSVVAAPRLYGRERRTLHWLDSGVAQGGDGRASVVLPSCMTTGLRMKLPRL